MLKNKIKTIGYPLIYRINQKNFIKVQSFEGKKNRYCDVTFYNTMQEKFIGRFKGYTSIGVLYNSGKILIYSDEYNKDKNEFNITDVIALYEILDDTFYSVTEAEALNLFDENLSVEHLKNKDNQIHRSDTEKRKRLELSK